jgi:GntR family transcriptional repressor for pyruvate dehydrogenase complex
VDGVRWRMRPGLFLQFAGVTYREVSEARLILEPIAVRHAAERQKGNNAAAELVELARRGTVAGNDKDYLDTTTDFHSAVIALGENGVVTLLCQSLGAIYRDHAHGALFPKNRQSDVHEIHLEIAQAIYQGDGKRSQSLMTEHMQQYTHYLSKRHPALLDEVVR